MIKRQHDDRTVWWGNGILKKLYNRGTTLSEG